MLPTMHTEIVDAARLTGDPQARQRFAREAHQILFGLVRDGAALGWVDPPAEAEVAELIDEILSHVAVGDASLRAAYVDDVLVGLGYWLSLIHISEPTRPY